MSTFTWTMVLIFLLGSILAPTDAQIILQEEENPDFRTLFQQNEPGNLNYTFIFYAPYFLVSNSIINLLLWFKCCSIQTLTLPSYDINTSNMICVFMFQTKDHLYKVGEVMNSCPIFHWAESCKFAFYFYISYQL